MLNFIKNLFGKKNKPKDFTQEEFEADYDLKTKGLEHVLGKMHDQVGHAIIPFAIGGAVDMYYFPNHVKGTGFATMELLEPDGSGPRPNRLGTYELVAFTKQNLEHSDDASAPFNLIERKVCHIFTVIGAYSREAVLNPNETCEVPNGEGQENTCVVFDLYKPGNTDFRIGDRAHHLLLCLQVFRSELAYSRTNGSAKLLQRLKEAGHYPYSDLDREPVA